MLPGGRMNERQMQAMMKRLGMSTQPLEGVEEVIIRMRDKEHVLRAPEVTILTVQGVRTFQVVGEVEVRPRSAVVAEAHAGAGSTAPAGPPPAPEEDVQLVIEQTGVTHEEAVKALDEAGGAPAEAILSILSRRGGGDR
jgi:nascent polypeptide-associated complex subunit alpha